MSHLKGCKISPPSPEGAVGMSGAAPGNHLGTQSPNFFLARKISHYPQDVDNGIFDCLEKQPKTMLQII